MSLFYFNVSVSFSYIVSADQTTMKWLILFLIIAGVCTEEITGWKHFTLINNFTASIFKFRPSKQSDIGILASIKYISNNFPRSD